MCADLLVIGDAMMDVTVKARAASLSGTCPSTILISPGGLGNVAVAAASCGAEAAFIGKVGYDAFGRIYESDLAARRIPALILGCRAPTGVCINLVCADGKRTMYTSRGANDFLMAEEIPEDLLASSKIVFLSGFSMETGRSARQMELLSKRAKECGRQLAVGGGAHNIIRMRRRRFCRLIRRYADILILNGDEAEALAGTSDKDEAFDLVRELADLVVVTLGPRGSIASRCGSVTRTPGMAGRAVDTTGAGDAFTGAFLAGILQGLSLVETLRSSNERAARSVSHIGPR